MISTLKSKMGQIQAEEAAIGELLAQIKGLNLSPEQSAVLTQLEDHHARLRSEASFFKMA